MLRQRAISAALLVPPLVVVLILGGAWIVALIVIATALAAIEIFRLLRSAGYPSVPALGVVLAVGLVLDAAAPKDLEASGLILVAHTAADTFTAVTATCTHESCTITGFTGQAFVCPCHGSRFSTSGVVQNGPATRSLRSFATRFASNVLTISV